MLKCTDWAKNNLKRGWISAGVNAATSLIPEAHRRLASLRGGTSAPEGSHHVEDLATDTYLSLLQLVERSVEFFFFDSLDSIDTLYVSFPFSSM